MVLWLCGCMWRANCDQVFTFKSTARKVEEKIGNSFGSVLMMVQVVIRNFQEWISNYLLECTMWQVIIVNKIMVINVL